MMGKEAMEKLIKNASPVFPADPIAVGHTWNQETTTPMPGGLGEMQLESTYTYKGRETVEGKELEVIDIGKQPSTSQIRVPREKCTLTRPMDTRHQ